MSIFAQARSCASLELSFDFGFMLLEPWSTFETVRNNLAFLREFAGDGAAAVSFCRTLPYAGTPLKARLVAEGRLNENAFDADYRFLDPRLDVFYDWSLDAFANRNSTAAGLANLLRLLLFEAHLDLPNRPGNVEFREWAWHFTSIANRILLDTLEAALDTIESNPFVSIEHPSLLMLKAHQSAEDARLHRDLARLVQHRPDFQERLHLVR